MSNTQNVKLGVCRVFYDGNDLGYTKGGVEVEVSTDTHSVMVDQFGESEINQYIQKRSIKVKAPLAETTLENMVAIMPGATLVDNAIKQVTEVAISGTTTGTHSLTIDGTVYSFTDDGSPTEGEMAIGLANAINADPSAPCEATATDGAGQPAVASDVTGAIILASKVSGLLGTFVVSAPSTNIGIPNELIAAEDGAKRVDVTNGIGTDLLANAKPLTLHPKGKADSDKSEDFNIPLAATAGALQFAYKFDEERVFNVEFTGYPDSTTSILFNFGDSAATA